MVWDAGSGEEGELDDIDCAAGSSRNSDCIDPTVKPATPTANTRPELRTPEQTAQSREVARLGSQAYQPRKADKPREALPLSGEIINSIGMKLKLIPAGEFVMSTGESPESLAKAFDTKAEYFHDEQPQHRVRITKPYYLGVTEITQGQWETLMGTSPWKGKTFVKEGSDYAASYITWKDAVSFCRKLSEKEELQYRLPTEAEWEYACRAGNTTRFGFGDSGSSLGLYAWYGGGSALDVGEKCAQQVGRKQGNAWGLYDMHGNVFEWCQDWYDEGYYMNSTTDDPTGPSSGLYRVLRGGSWNSVAWGCRSANRIELSPVSRYSYLGFRVALVPSE